MASKEKVKKAEEEPVALAELEEPTETAEKEVHPDEKEVIAKPLAVIQKGLQDKIPEDFFREMQNSLLERDEHPHPQENDWMPPDVYVEYQPKLPPALIPDGLQPPEVVPIEPDEVSEHGIQYCANLTYLPRALLRGFESAQDHNLTVALALVEIANYGALETIHGEQEANMMAWAMGQAIRDAARPEDIVIRCGKDLFAVLLMNSSELVAARACQRYKEALHKWCYLQHNLDPEPEFAFGCSDHEPRVDANVEKLIRSAETTLGVATNLGDGACVRCFDLTDLSKTLTIPGHFQIGDRLTHNEPEIDPTTRKKKKEPANKSK